MVKNLPDDTGDARVAVLILGSRRSPGVGNGNLLQYSCLEKHHGQKSLLGYSHRVAKSRTSDMTEQLNRNKEGVRNGALMPPRNPSTNVR